MDKNYFAFPKKKYGKGNKKRTPQRERSYWTKKCLSVWSKIIRERVGNICEKCGRVAHLQAHHIISRGNHPKAGWFRYENGVSLCPYCHKYHGAHSTDIDEQIAFRNWVKEYLSKKNINYDILKIICNSRGGMKTSDLKLLHIQMGKDLEEVKRMNKI